MNILMLSTYPHGGASKAAQRLRRALVAEQQEVPFLTAAEAGHRWPFYAERLSFLPYERDKSVRFAFSLANFGQNIAQHPLVQQADIINPHWINQGFLSLHNLQQLASLGKPVVWGLHDMWAFTGGCHYSGTCTRYEQACGHCPFLKNPGPTDLSHRIWQRKQRQLPSNLHFVASSDWLAECARSSSLLRNYPVHSIPIPVDTQVFAPATPEGRQRFRATHGIAPDRIILLFVAIKVSEPRKGFHHLREALQMLRATRPGLALDVVVLGNSDPVIAQALPYPVHALGMVRDEAQLAQIYGAADVFVIPSLEDNLPNTVLEALACGTPVAGFSTGGIPQMVDHEQQGFIAPQADSKALAEGIRWIVQGPVPLAALQQAARRKAETHYANAVVAKRYLTLFEGLLF
jgi:glycosyltransferase involved in cell wall biosynthesis